MTDKKKPTFVVPGYDYQIVPIGASAILSFMILNGTMLKVFAGAIHATCSTIKNEVYEDLHAFFKPRRSASTY